MYSRRYSATNAHAPYCHLWPATLYNMFPPYLINGTIFGGVGKKKKKVIKQKILVGKNTKNFFF